MLALCSFQGSFEFVAEEGDDGKVEFLVPFYFAEKLRTAVASGDFSFSTRARRLAQEIASLSTSLPLSFSSSVFLRCDENRLDLMKVILYKNVLPPLVVSVLLASISGFAITAVVPTESQEWKIKSSQNSILLSLG